MLSDADSSDDGGNDNHQLVVNEYFAKTFQLRKEREELQKLKDKYGSDFDGSDSEDASSDSESDESEDEDGEQLTPAVDAALLRTLAKIKRKDPEIYQTNKKIYEEEHQRVPQVQFSSATTSKVKPSKSLSVRQAALDEMLEGPSARSPSPQPRTYAEEQSALRAETISAFRKADERSDDDDDDFLIHREKAEDELAQEEGDYRAFLERQIGPDLEQLATFDQGPDVSSPANETTLLSEPIPKKKLRKKPKAPSGKSKEEEDHEFLMQYILNRGWIDKSSKRVPTYKEVTSTKRQKVVPSKSPTLEREEDQEDEGMNSEEFEDFAEDFETTYNFRFEEPDADKIRTYPRQIDSTARRGDSSRKEARERKMLRKEEQKRVKREEIKRLKALKMKELHSKLEKVAREGGLKDFNMNDEALRQLGLDGDWDPEEHDNGMTTLYGNDNEAEEDIEKPSWDNDIDIDDIIAGTSAPEPGPSSRKRKRKRESNDFDDDGIDVDEMDANQVLDHENYGGEEEEEWDGTEESRKKLVDRYFDEIYALDFNDIVGDQPTRFHYTAVEPEAFALTPAEILLATDQELNEYRSIKKYAPYRKQNKWDPNRGQKLQTLRSKLLERASSSGWLPEPSNGSRGGQVKKRMGKKERQRLKQQAEANPPVPSSSTANTEEQRPTGDSEGTAGAQAASGSKKRKRRRPQHQS